jgi:hypothetical protein
VLSVCSKSSFSASKGSAAESSNDQLSSGANCYGGEDIPWFAIFWMLIRCQSIRRDYDLGSQALNQPKAGRSRLSLLPSAKYCQITLTLPSFFGNRQYVLKTSQEAPILAFTSYTGFVSQSQWSYCILTAVYIKLPRQNKPGSTRLNYGHNGQNRKESSRLIRQTHTNNRWMWTVGSPDSL